MNTTDHTDQPTETAAAQANDLFDSVELAQAVNTEEFRGFLDFIPIAIVISKFIRGDQRICYANKSFEKLIGQELAEFSGRGWSILALFKDETDHKFTLHDAMLKWSDEFLGTFRCDRPQPVTVEAFAGLIENDDGTENYRIAALIDVTNRQRAEREEFARQLRDKDTLLKEVQHRVKNNLQLIVALIRLEARAERRGEKVNLTALTGRIESLYLLYHALSADHPGQQIELGHYLSQIAAAVMNTYAVDGIRLDTKMDHAPASINVGLPMGLIVNELITNAFKHAFGSRGHGVIKVHCLRVDDDNYCVSVEDDGQGLPPGVQWPMPGKIGSLVLQSLRENTRTDVSVESNPGKGLKIALTFANNLASPKPN